MSTDPATNPNPAESADSSATTDPIWATRPAPDVGHPGSAGNPTEGDRYNPLEPDVQNRAEPDRPPRVGTIVWGLVAAAVGVVVLLTQLTDIRFDPAQLFIGLLIGAGLALIIGGLITAIRPSNRRRDQRTS